MGKRGPKPTSPRVLATCKRHGFVLHVVETCNRCLKCKAQIQRKKSKEEKRGE